MTALGLFPFDGSLPWWWMAIYLGGIVLLPLVVLAVIALKLMGGRRRLISREPVEPAAIPADLIRCGQPWLGRLAYLGFPVAQVVQPEDDAGEESVSWQLVSAKDRAVGVLTGSLPAGGGKPTFSLTLHTFLSDGRVILTADRPLTHRPPAHWSLLRERFTTLESHVQEHRSHVANRSGGVAAVMPTHAGQIAARMAAEDRAVLEALIASHDYAPAGEGVIRPALSRLPLLACREFAGIFTGAAFPPGRPKDVASVSKSNTPGEEEIAPTGGAMTLSLEQMVEQDVRRFRKHADQPAGKKHLLLRIAVLVATLIFFTATFGRENPAATAGMLLGLIALHEFGHWLMMKITGYEGMGRFFVPFFGPVDRGRKLHATPWQQLFVILAGPVPGLLMGMAILVAGFFLPGLPLWLLDLGGLAVVLNAFHLLPFLPLDGGKVVDLLVFRDLPFIRPLFTLVSAVATLLASFLLKSRAIRVVALGMFIGLIWDLKMIKVVRGGRKLRWAGSVNDENEALRKIFHGVREEQNEAFLRSDDWQRQIGVLLAEVLRKRPGFFTRLTGGWLYGTLCGLPILIILAVFALLAFGEMARLGRHAADSQEFVEAFPKETRSITAVQLASVQALVDATAPYLPLPGSPQASAEKRKATASKAGPELAMKLDGLDWKSAGIAHHGDVIDAPALALWLEILCARMEKALSTAPADATRRAELLLHAVHSMEPALTYAHRVALWDAELRTLEVVDRLAATGRLKLADLARIYGRVNQLNIAPRPEVENLLLVSGNGTRRVEEIMAAVADEPDAAKLGSLPDPRFWRHAYPPIRQLAAEGFFLEPKPPATVMLARHWAKTRRAGEIPLEMPEPVSADRGEAEFIMSFCESHRRISWRRLASLAALRLEEYRQKNGRFPPLWKLSVPGGANMELVHEGGPFLQFTDRRELIQETLPKWLGESHRKPASLDHVCPLFGAR